MKNEMRSEITYLFWLSYVFSSPVLVHPFSVHPIRLSTSLSIHPPVHQSLSIVPFVYALQWNLVCSRAALVQLSQTLVMAGMFVGASLLTNLADRYGRKWTHLGCHLALLTATMAMAFMPTYGSFIATKFIAGVFQQVRGARKVCV